MKAFSPRNEAQIIRLQREANALLSLDHPAIPKMDFEDYFRVQIPGGSLLYCLVMSKIEGETVNDKYNGFKASQKEIITFLKQIFEILHYLHNKNFFHRDIKPDNIIVNDGVFSLIDFGVVKELNDSYFRLINDNTAPVSQVNSPFYSAPEQQAGRAVPQSDFFSVGRTAIFMVTGIPFYNMPYDSKGNFLWRQHAKHIDKPVVDFLTRLTSGSLVRRPQCTEEVLEFLNVELPKKIRISNLLNSKIFTLSVSIIVLCFIVLGSNLYKERYAVYLVYQALELAQRGLTDKARALLTESIAIKPTYTGYNSLGLLCAKERDWECAFPNLEKAIALVPERWPAYYNLASQYDEARQWTRAEQLYEKALRLSGGKAPEPLNNLARLAILRKDYKRADQLIRKGLAVVPGNIGRAAYLKNAGWSNFEQGNLALADRQLRQSIQLNPQESSPYCLLAQVVEARTGKVALDLWQNCLYTQGGDMYAPEVYDWRQYFYKAKLKL